MVIIFALSTIHWVTSISVVVTFLVIRALFSELNLATHSLSNWLPMFVAVLLVSVSTSCNASHDLTRLPDFFD